MSEAINLCTKSNSAITIQISAIASQSVKKWRKNKKTPLG